MLKRTGTPSPGVIEDGVDPSDLAFLLGNIPPAPGTVATPHCVELVSVDSSLMVEADPMMVALMDPSQRRIIRSGQTILPKYQGPEEARLRRQFRGLVVNTALPQILQPLPDRQLPSSVSDYALVPVHAKDRNSHSSDDAGKAIVVPRYIKTNYRSEGELPYLDAGLAIGLAFREELVALAAAGMALNGALRIVQIQGVTMNAAAKSKERFKSGLHGGFAWRDTLVAAWLRIGECIGVEKVEIVSAANNAWYRKGRVRQLQQGYNHVAERMGFSRDKKTGDWVLKLAGVTR
jgi:hypothetical protein